jgi:hypothetical protein
MIYITSWIPYMISAPSCKYLVPVCLFIPLFSSFVSLDPATNKYDPRDKAWLKQKVFAHLRGQAAK